MSNDTSSGGLSAAAEKIIEHETSSTSDISERVESFPEPWKPEVGDKLVGEVIGVEQRNGEYGSYPIVVVMTEDGSEFAFHGFHTVAKNELAKQRPEVGDKIAIKYFGRTEDDRGYERYRILVDKPQEAVDWDAIGEEAAVELGEGVQTPPPPEIGDLPMAPGA
jgi:hypothetical protein